MNHATQLRFAAESRVELDQGRLLLACPGTGGGFTVAAADAEVAAHGAQVDLECRPDGTLVTVSSGAAQCTTPSGIEQLSAGERLLIAKGGALQRQPIDDVLLATGWINDILACKSPSDMELTERVGQLLAQVGRSKLSHLYEEEIRALGESCVLPMLRYAQSNPAGEPAVQRIEAARLLADLAPVWAIPELVELLADDEPEVRGHAARALTRLTGHSFDLPASAWPTASAELRREAQRAWRQWWDTNRHRFARIAG